MLDCASFYRTLEETGVTFFTGVPDSLLKDICAYITDHTKVSSHVITANEGAAIALATGFHLASGTLSLVYLQNSGLGNLVNPLTSLTDPEVYGIPMLLLIGWRGQPGVPDEPQHRKQGRITPSMLDALEIPYVIVPDEDAAAEEAVRAGVERARRGSGPFALLVRKGTFQPYKLQPRNAPEFPLRREEAIQLVLGTLNNEDVVVSTTGMASREVFEYRAAKAQGHGRDFLTVGCMGHASQIAMGIATARPERHVYCLDGDGAMLMHMGSLAVIGASGAENFRHIVVNNGAHDSVGGQPTVGLSIALPAIARSCNYVWSRSVSDPSEIANALQEMRTVKGPTLLEIRVKKGARKDLGRPTTTPLENKEAFMRNLGVER